MDPVLTQGREVPVIVLDVVSLKDLSGFEVTHIRLFGTSGLQGPGDLGQVLLDGGLSGGLEVARRHRRPLPLDGGSNLQVEVKGTLNEKCVPLCCPTGN
jgi:hypothetical protein